MRLKFAMKSPALAASGLCTVTFAAAQPEAHREIKTPSKHICDPFTAYLSIMKNPMEEAKLQNYGAFLNDAHNNALPAVSFVRLFEALAGHPADSITDLYEKFLEDLINQVKSDLKLVFMGK